jgi:hypothetical protein
MAKGSAVASESKKVAFVHNIPLPLPGTPYKFSNTKAATMEPLHVSPPQTAAETALQADCDQDVRVPYYCEENVWRLAYRKTHQEPEHRYFVAFISNSIKYVPMFQQRASSDVDSPCCWDYHVILLSVTCPENNVLVWDFDSRLPYPCPLSDYLEESFPYDYDEPYAPLFRLSPASSFLKNFSSDRMHMYDIKTQTWNAPPPHYDCILSGPSNLKSYLDFKQRSSPPTADDLKYGRDFNLLEFEVYNFAEASEN